MVAGKCIDSTLAPWKISVMFAARNVGLPGCSVGHRLLLHGGYVCHVRIKVRTVVLYESVRL